MSRSMRSQRQSNIRHLSEETVRKLLYREVKQRMIADGRLPAPQPKVVPGKYVFRMVTDPYGPSHEVQANTKSEARSLFKKLTGQPIPPGTLIVKVDFNAVAQTIPSESPASSP